MGTGQHYAGNEPAGNGVQDAAESIRGDGVMGNMTTPTVTEIPPSLARVEPDPFINDETRLAGGLQEYRYGDSNPGFRRERAAS